MRNAEEPAFALLYARFSERIYAFSYRRLRDHTDAEEAVQETFTAVFRSIDAYRGESPLASWIYGIARNTVNNQIRRAAARRRRMARAHSELLRAGVATPPGTPEDALNLQRSVERIGACLASVSGWQAEVFALRHVEDLPIEEIARRTSRSRDSVRSSLCRVKALLVEALCPRAASPGRAAAAAQPSARSAARSAAAASRSAGSRGARRPM